MSKQRNSTFGKQFHAFQHYIKTSNFAAKHCSSGFKRDLITHLRNLIRELFLLLCDVRVLELANGTTFADIELGRNILSSDPHASVAFVPHYSLLEELLSACNHNLLGPFSASPYLPATLREWNRVRRNKR